MAQDKPRTYGFDLIRLASFFAIAVFHITLVHWSTESIAVADRSLLLNGVEVYARSLAFSGFTVVFLTTLLIAYSHTQLTRRLRLFGFLCFGWLAFSAVIHSPWGFLSWDIYPLILFGVLAATIAERWHRKILWGMGALGLVVLCLPVWELSQFLKVSYHLGNVLGIVSCSSQKAEWPILPWMGLVWLGYGCGCALRSGQYSPESSLWNVTTKEMAVWGPGLVLGALTWGGYYNIQLGGQFACEAYRQDPLVFWGHFVWVLFFVRLSLDGRVQRFLGRLSLVRWISTLAISRKFWLAYICHYFIAHILSHVVWAVELHRYRFHDHVIELICFAYLPLTEIVTRGILGLGKEAQKVWSKLNPEGAAVRHSHHPET